jgi:hypothetical protein
MTMRQLAFDTLRVALDIAALLAVLVCIAEIALPDPPKAAPAFNAWSHHKYASLEQ